MLNEHIGENATVKLYHTEQVIDNFYGKGDFQICAGKIVKIISVSEIEVELQGDIFPELKKDICYILHIQVAQKIYQCSIYYQSMYADDGINYICLEIVSPLEKLQRRMHQRVTCHSKVTLEVLNREQIQKVLLEGIGNIEEYPLNKDLSEDSMVDISGGGIRFTSKRNIEKGDYIFVCFEISVGGVTKELNIIGQVVYSALLPNDKEILDVRMKYVGLPESERKRIIQFVFQLERDEMKKNWN